MAKGLVDIILDSIFDEEWTGRRGEKLTERELKLVRFLGRKGKILRNIYVPKDNGETSEIDIVYITQKGIFVFESKNYSGWIFGDGKSMYWTVSLPNGQKNRFYNPVKQNRTHIKWLNKYMNGKVPLFSIIVFSERCELKKVSVEDESVRVIKRDRTYATVRDIWNQSPDVLSEENVVEIYDRLQTLTKVDEAVKLAHTQRIKKKYKTRPEKEDTLPVIKPTESPEEGIQETEQKKSQEEKDNSSQPIVCPRCGKALVLRTAKKGNSAGKQFYGCSGFPKCRFIQNV